MWLGGNVAHYSPDQPASADRRPAAPRAMDRSRRSARQGRDTGVGRGRLITCRPNSPPSRLRRKSARPSRCRARRFGSRREHIGWAILDAAISRRQSERVESYITASDHPAHLVENLADLRLADDQRRRQRERIAGDADHQRPHRGTRGPSPHKRGRRMRRARGEIDAGSQPDGADIEHDRASLSAPSPRRRTSAPARAARSNNFSSR